MQDVKPKIYNLFRFRSERGYIMYSVFPKPRDCPDGNYVFHSESKARHWARELHGYSKIAKGTY